LRQLNKRKRERKINSLRQQIKRYKEYIREENPVMKRTIEAYKKELVILESQLRKLESREVKNVNNI